jgi:hypothetical protein
MGQLSFTSAPSFGYCSILLSMAVFATSLKTLKDKNGQFVLRMPYNMVHQASWRVRLLSDPEVSRTILSFGEGVDLAYEDHSLGCRLDVMLTLHGTQLQRVQHLPALSGRHTARSLTIPNFSIITLSSESLICVTPIKASQVSSLIRKISIRQFALEVDLQELLAFSLISRWRERGSLEEMGPASFFVWVRYSRTGLVQV